MTETRNILFICLDSVRYDTFETSDAKNMKAVGPLKKVHAVACTTLPSMIAYLNGLPPIGSGRNDLFNRDYEATGWAPRSFAGSGWATAWLSSNPEILLFDSNFSGIFQRYFKYFKSIEYLKKFIRDGRLTHIVGDPGPWDTSVTPEIVADVEEIMKMEEGRSVFMTILTMDTHEPYNSAGGSFDLDPSDPEKNFRHQVKAIEFFDDFFPEIVNQFRARGKTDVIITADHGELFGPVYRGHNPAKPYLRFDRKLFEIPFIVGELGE
jgi:hypothetical protein